MNITQEELAFRCNLTQGHINYIENGKRGFTKKSLEKIAKVLGVQISVLFEKGKERLLNLLRYTGKEAEYIMRSLPS